MRTNDSGAEIALNSGGVANLFHKSANISLKYRILFGTCVSAMDFPTDGFEGLVFDLDGTLVDSMPAHFEAWCEALSQVGADGVFGEDVFYAMGGRPTKDIVVQLNEEYGLKLDPDTVAFAKKKAFLERLDQVTLNEEVVEYAKTWRGKVPMAIATGGSRLVAEKTLQVLGLSDLFDEVVTADDVTNGKPDPEVFLQAAERIGIEPTKCVAFEDAAPGIMAAQLAGMQVVAVPAPMHLV
ncbi:HAD family hydrolase [Roseibacillus persicicus]